MKSNYIKHILLILIFSLVFNSDKKQQNFIVSPWLWASSKIEGDTIDGESTEVVTKIDDNTIKIDYYDNKYSTTYTIHSNGSYSIACGVVRNWNEVIHPNDVPADYTVGRDSKCTLHSLEMNRTEVEIIYGLPNESQMREMNIKETSFPNGRDYILGGCIVLSEMDVKAIIYQCSNCVEVRNKWLEKNSILTPTQRI